MPPISCPFPSAFFLQQSPVPAFHLFNFFRYVLAIVASVYATVITIQSLWNWYLWLAGQDRYVSLVRRYIVVHSLRLRFRTFWGDVIICHHVEEAWIVNQWPRLRDKRVIWRTCGQSDARKEEVMRPLHDDGLQIIRYSPREKDAFTRLGVFAGQDDLIRFGKYVGDYGPWIGDDITVGNVTQNMAGRGEFCGLHWYRAATQDLPAKPAGPFSEPLTGGVRGLTSPAVLDYLLRVRA